MKKNRIVRKTWRLVARQSACRLTLTEPLKDEIVRMYEERIRRFEKTYDCDDARAFAMSLEWEHLGDFFARTGSAGRAVSAYRTAMDYCLDGTNYGNIDGRRHYGQMLTARYIRLADKAASAGGAEELSNLLLRYLKRP